VPQGHHALGARLGPTGRAARAGRAIQGQQQRLGVRPETWPRTRRRRRGRSPRTWSGGEGVGRREGAFHHVGRLRRGPVGKAARPAPSATPAACTSMGQGARRWLSSVARTTTSQPAKRSSLGPPLGDGERADDVGAGPRGEENDVAGERRPRVDDRRQGGRSRRRRARRPSTASAQDCATTAATASPTNRTTPSASHGRVMAWCIVSMAGGSGARSRSAAVKHRHDAGGVERRHRWSTADDAGVGDGGPHVGRPAGRRRGGGWSR